MSNSTLPSNVCLPNAQMPHNRHNLHNLHHCQFLIALTTLTYLTDSTTSGSSGAARYYHPSFPVSFNFAQGVQRRIRAIPGAVLRILADDDGGVGPAGL